MAALVTPYGYPLEEHFVQTGDGYILRIFRIQHGTCSRSLQGQKPVVFLQHGLLDSSAGFVLNGPNRSLGFILADAGYDVWMGNVRGSFFSRNHSFLSTYSANYWSFSYDEMGLVDLPAMVSYVKAATGAARLSYIGHSQGTTAALAGLSVDQGLADSLTVAILLAPVAFATHISSVPLIALSQLNTPALFALLGFHEFLPSVELMSRWEGEMCGSQPHLCANILAAIAGYNEDNVDDSHLPLYLKYTPAGSSVQNMAHWSQAMRQKEPGVMSRFDYGTSCVGLLARKRCNQDRYGQLTPPAYDLSAITIPVVLFSGGLDVLSAPPDVELLVEALLPDTLRARHDLPHYAHLDFMWASNAHELLFPSVMAHLPPTTKLADGPAADV